MLYADLFRVSLRMLSRRRRRTWITLLGVVLGITAITAIVTLVEAMAAAAAEEKLVLSTIVLIALVIGAAGIALSMHAAVIEHASELGIMKAIGASNATVTFLVVAQAGVLGLLGGLGGAAAGSSMLLIVTIAAASNGTAAAATSTPLIFSSVLLAALIGMSTGWLSVQKIAGKAPARIIAKP